MKTLVTVTIVSLVLALHMPIQAKEPPPAFVIAAVSENSITFEEGGRIVVDASTKVIKKGYDFTLKDLRPGWAVVTYPAPGSPEARFEPATKIEVVGIPVVNSFAPYRGRPVVIQIGRAELGFMPVVEALKGVDVQQALETMAGSVP